MLGFDGGLVLDVWALLRIVLNKYKENHSANQHHTWPMSYYSEVIIQSSDNISLQWWQLFTCSSYMHNTLRAKEDISNIGLVAIALKTLNLKKSPYGLFLAILKNHCGFYNNSVFPTRLLSSYWELKKGKGLRLKSNVHIVYIAFLVKVLTQKTHVLYKDQKIDWKRIETPIWPSKSLFLC